MTRTSGSSSAATADQARWEEVMPCTASTVGGPAARTPVVVSGSHTPTVSSPPRTGTVTRW